MSLTEASGGSDGGTAALPVLGFQPACFRNVVENLAVAASSLRTEYGADVRYGF